MHININSSVMSRLPSIAVLRVTICQRHMTTICAIMHTQRFDVFDVIDFYGMLYLFMS